MSYPLADSVVPIDITSIAASAGASPSAVADVVSKQTARVGCLTSAWGFANISTGDDISDVSSLRDKSQSRGHLYADSTPTVMYESEYRVVDGKRYGDAEVSDMKSDDVSVEVESLKIFASTESINLTGHQGMKEILHLRSKWSALSYSRVGMTLRFVTSSGSFWNTNTEARLVVVIERSSNMFSMMLNSRGPNYSYAGESMRIPGIPSDITINSFPYDFITSTSADLATGVSSSILTRDISADSAYTSDGVHRTVAVVHPRAMMGSSDQVLVTVNELGSNNAISTRSRSEAFYTGYVRVRMFVHFQGDTGSSNRTIPVDTELVDIKGVSPPNLMFVNALTGTRSDGACAVSTIDQKFAPDILTDVEFGRQVFLTSSCVLWRDARLGNFACVFVGSGRDGVFAPTCFVSGFGCVNPSSSGNEGTVKRVQAWLTNAPSRDAFVESPSFEPSEDVNRTVPAVFCFSQYNSAVDAGAAVHAGVRSATPLHNYVDCPLLFENPAFIVNNCAYIDERARATSAVVVLTNLDGPGSSIDCVEPYADHVGVPRLCSSVAWSNKTSELREEELAASCGGALLTDMWNILVREDCQLRIKTSANASGTITTGLVLSTSAKVTVDDLDVPLVRLESKWQASEQTAAALCVSGVFNGSNKSSNASIRAHTTHQDVAIGDGSKIPVYCVMMRTKETTVGSETRFLMDAYSCQQSRLDLPHVFSEGVSSPHELKTGGCYIEIGFRGGNADVIVIDGEAEMKSDDVEDYEDLFPIMELTGICPPRAGVFSPLRERTTYMQEVVVPSAFLATPPLVIRLPWPIRYLGNSYDRIVVPKTRVGFLLGSAAASESLDVFDPEPNPRSLPGCPGVVLIGQGTTILEKVETQTSPDGQTFRIVVRGLTEYDDGAPAPFRVALETCRASPSVLTVRMMSARFIAGSLSGDGADDYRGGLVAQRPAAVPVAIAGGEASSSFSPQSRRTYWLFRVPFVSGRSYVIAESAGGAADLRVAADAVTPYAWDAQVERSKAHQLRLMHSEVWGSSLAFVTRGARVRGCLGQSVERQHGVLSAFRLTAARKKIDDHVLTLRHAGFKTDYTHDTSSFGVVALQVFTASRTLTNTGLESFISYNNSSNANEFAVPVRFSEPDSAEEEPAQTETLAILRSTPQSWGVRSDKQPLFPPALRAQGQQTMTRTYGDAFGSAASFVRRSRPRTF